MNKKQAIALCISIALCLVSMELLLRMIYFSYADYNTEMWRYARYFKQYSANPSRGHEHIPHARGTLYGVNVSINSVGLRDYEYQWEKPNNTLRVLVLGDSITFGWGVQFEKIFVKQLETLLKRDYPKINVEVINFGVGNYNTQMEYEMFKDTGVAFNPDVVILAYFINDAEYIVEKKNVFDLFKRLYLYQFFYDKITSAVARYSTAYRYTDFYKQLYADGFIGKQNAQNALLDLINVTKRMELPLYIFVIPELHTLDPYPFPEVVAFVNETTHDDAPVYDLLPFFMNQTPNALWVSSEDQHPNALGHAIIAEAMLKTFINDLVFNTTIQKIRT